MLRRLIVGLGNPGQNYIRTRHNIGFMVVDRLVSRSGARPVETDGPYCLWLAEFRDAQIFFMQPLTYMNLSGQAVAHFLRSHPIPMRDVLVVYDDVSLPLGRLRVRPKGSAGGHNGIANIMDTLESNALPRLRVGVASQLRGHQPLRDFVLSPFRSDEAEALAAAVRFSALAAWSWLRKDISQVMGTFNAQIGFAP